MSSFRLWVADDAEVLGSLKNTFELQAGVFLRAVSLIGVKGSSIRPQKYVMDGFTHLKRSNQDESPGLHQAHRGRVMSSLQKSAQHFVPQGLRQKTRPDIAPLANSTIDAPRLIFGELLCAFHHQAFDQRVLLCVSSRSFESTPACTSNSLPKSHRRSDKRFR